MTIIKQYNSNTASWEAVVVGKQGPAGIESGATQPSSTDVLWLDTTDQGDAVVPIGGTTGQMLVKNSSTSYDTSWATPGMRLIKTQTVGTAVSSVEVTDVFSSSYDSYLITVRGLSGSTSAYPQIRLQLGAVTTTYYFSIYYDQHAGGSTGTTRGTNTTHIAVGYLADSLINSTNITIHGPNLAENTHANGQWNIGDNVGWFGGSLRNTTQYTSFKLSPSVGTLTGGTIKVYGYM